MSILRHCANDAKASIARATAYVSTAGLLDDSGPDYAATTARRLEHARNAMHGIGADGPPATVSIGWCVYRGSDAPIDLLLAAADAAMYRAKALGRNRVEGSADAAAPQRPRPAAAWWFVRSAGNR